MRACVIFNPAAKGQRAERLRRQLGMISHYAALRQTQAAGDARRLAAAAIAEGCDAVIAAGGDGTVNEVLNGIGDADAFGRVRLGVLPLGTINVFAKQLKIPSNVRQAWNLIVRGRYTRVDLAWAEFAAQGTPQRRYFAQLGGVGLDARAIELLDWGQKKQFGPLAYVAAGWKALNERQPQLTVTSGNLLLEGELALIGNGQFYGGRIRVLEGANLRDGHLDLCLFKRAGRFSAVANGLYAVAFRQLPGFGLRRLRAKEFTIGAIPPVGFELDGEYVGQTPVKFGVLQEKLRVIVP